MTQPLRLSYEFFPPKTDAGIEKVQATCDALNATAPSFFSVTYGAGGSTRDNTKQVVFDIAKKGIDVAPHLSFGGDDEDTMLALLKEYQAAGIKRIVALRGDAPSGLGLGNLVYANELVEFIRKHTGEHFELEVAAYPEIHPQADSYDEDIRYLKQKLDAGANNAITQYFYNIDSYYYFIDACNKAGITQPIYPGIMPIINYKNLQRFSGNCGADIPRWLHYKLSNYSDDTSMRKFAEEFMINFCEKLIAAGAPGLHFYTMNQTEPTLNMVNTLKKNNIL